MGAFPCFMPKPFMGVSANGCHTNLSLWKGDTNLFLPEGDNSAHAVARLGLNAIGGILEHLRALTVHHGADGELLPPLLGARASGRRCSPTGATRTAPPPCACPAPDRFEYRSVDAAVNPYLAAGRR